MLENSSLNPKSKCPIGKGDIIRGVVHELRMIGRQGSAAFLDFRDYVQRSDRNEVAEFMSSGNN